MLSTVVFWQDRYFMDGSFIFSFVFLNLFCMSFNRFALSALFRLLRYHFFKIKIPKIVNQFLEIWKFGYTFDVGVCNKAFTSFYRNRRESSRKNFLTTGWWWLVMHFSGRSCTHRFITIGERFYASRYNFIIRTHFKHAFPIEKRSGASNVSCEWNIRTFWGFQRSTSNNLHYRAWNQKYS